MDAVIQLLISIALAYGYAAGGMLILRSIARPGLVLSTVAPAAVLFIPLSIPAGLPIFRAIAALAGVELMFKMIDLARERREGRRVSVADVLKFLIPFPAFVVVLADRRRRRVSGGELKPALLKVMLGGCVAGVTLCIFAALSANDFLESHFALDHAVKVLLFVGLVESLSRWVCGLERLAGCDTSPPMQSTFLSRTAAEFWWRFNHRVHRWLDCNVFRPAGGRHRPVRGTVWAFLVSALIHEALFAVATSRVDGYQFAFFALQIPAVLISRRLARFARSHGTGGNIVAWSATMLWFYFTSMFFFHAVGRIFPGYYAGEPWLP